ncbi:hypothetical protein MJ585_16750 [Klebsiella pneumoniae]|nr:hypothetical protein MJ585_16750 [Klebsiella pneumoniae]
MALGQLRGRYCALNARGTQFVCFIHWGLKIVSSAAKMLEVMRITIKPILLIAQGMIPV